MPRQQSDNVTTQSTKYWEEEINVKGISLIFGRIPHYSALTSQWGLLTGIYSLYRLLHGLYQTRNPWSVPDTKPLLHGLYQTWNLLYGMYQTRNLHGLYQTQNPRGDILFTKTTIWSVPDTGEVGGNERSCSKHTMLNTLNCTYKFFILGIAFWWK